MPSDEERLDRLEQAVRQLYQLESRFKPGKFGEKEPMPELEAILSEADALQRP